MSDKKKNSSEDSEAEQELTAHDEREYDNFKAVAGDGYLAHMLTRKSSQVRRDRAEGIAEDVKIAHQRMIEDYEIKINRLLRERRGYYDFSPDSTFSLVLAKDVKGVDVAARDEAATLEIRELRIKLASAKNRFNHLFGETYDSNETEEI